MQGDLFLSPEFRLLADAPGVPTFTYDGCGHRLVLPPGIPSTEPLPLVLVGPARSLRLVNVTLVHPESLSACLQVRRSSLLVRYPLRIPDPDPDPDLDLAVSE